MNVYKLLEKMNTSRNDYEYWSNLKKEMFDFLEGDYPQNEKELLGIGGKLGWLEAVCMICEGIKYMEEQEKLKQ